MGDSADGKHFLAEVDATEWQRRRFGAIHTVATFAIKGCELGSGPSLASSWYRAVLNGLPPPDCPIMTDYTERLVARLLDGSESTLMYGAADPTPAFNMHELIADTYVFTSAIERTYDPFCELSPAIAEPLKLQPRPYSMQTMTRSMAGPEKSDGPCNDLLPRCPRQRKFWMSGPTKSDPCQHLLPDPWLRLCAN